MKQILVAGLDGRTMTGRERRAWLRKNKIRVSRKAELAMCFLEHHGQEFLIHFGYGNALELARAKASYSVSDSPDLTDAAYTRLLDDHIAKVVGDSPSKKRKASAKQIEPEDVTIQPAPLRPGGWVHAKLKYAGRGKPGGLDEEA